MRNRNKIHITNEHGDQKVISQKEYNELQKSVEEDTNNKYYFDADWYLNNGCMSLEEMFEKIENEKDNC